MFPLETVDKGRGNGVPRVHPCDGFLDAASSVSDCISEHLVDGYLRLCSSDCSSRMQPDCMPLSRNRSVPDALVHLAGHNYGEQQMRIEVARAKARVFSAENAEARLSPNLARLLHKSIGLR